MKYDIFRKPKIGSLSKYKITTSNQNMNFEQLSKMIERSDIIIPEIQRGFVWDLKRSSKFIESIIMGIPIPSLIFYKQNNNKFLVIDGLQRLSTVSTFLLNKKRDIYTSLFDSNNKKGWKLSSDVSSEISGKSFHELSEEYSRKIRYGSINVIFFKEDEPGNQTSIVEVFSRINKESSPLNRQEIRNSIYKGEFNKKIKELNKNKIWRKILGSKEEDKRMLDVEMLAGVLAFYEIASNNSLDHNKLSSINRNDLIDNMYEYYSKDEFDELVSIFNKTIQKLKFLNNPISLYNNLTRKNRKKGNKILIETIIPLEMSNDISINQKFLENLVKIQREYESNFKYYFLEATNSIKRIKGRIEIIKEMNNDKFEKISKNTEEISKKVQK